MEQGDQQKAASGAGASRVFAGTTLATGVVTAPLSTQKEAGAVASNAVSCTLIINGETKQLQLDPRVTLLDLLRDHLGMTGAKKGCDHGQCGACTMLVNGKRINSCLTLAVMHDGDQITTIEGLATESKLHPCRRLLLSMTDFSAAIARLARSARLWRCSMK